MPFDPNISHSGTDRLSNIENGLVAASANADTAIAGIASTSATSANISQTAHGFSAGNWVRYNGTIYVKAEADLAADADVDGVVTASIDANTFTIQVGGLCTALAGLTSGSDYFLSPTTPGAITATEPSTAGQVSKPLLKAVSVSSGWIENTRGLVIPPAAVTYLFVKLVDDSTSITTGEGKFKFTVTSDLNGLSLVSVLATVSVAPTGSGLSLGVRKGAATEMLSTNVTIDTTKVSSTSSATPPVIKSDGSQTVATDDVISIDCDQADSNSVSRGSAVRLGFS